MELRTYCMDKSQIEYQEVPADDVLFERFYEFRNPKRTNCIAIPDGTIDIQCVWYGEKMQVLIAGSLKEGKISALSECDLCFGARLKRGNVPQFMKEQIEQVTVNRIPMEQFANAPDLQKYLRKNQTLAEKMEIMYEIFSKEDMPDSDNQLVKYLLDKIYSRKGHVVISDLVDETGYSARYAERCFKKNVGVSMKKYANIIRLQNSLGLVMAGKVDDIYSLLGYYDQAHFIHDFKRFTTLTPQILYNLVKQNKMQIV